MPTPIVPSVPFTVRALENALRKTKLGKAAEFNGIYPVFLKYTEPDT